MIKKYVEESIASYELSSGVDAFLKEIEERIKATGQPRDTIRIEINTIRGYGSDEPVLTLRYSRDETAEEAAERIKTQKAIEVYEKQQYERLKAKFENKA